MTEKKVNLRSTKATVRPPDAIKRQRFEQLVKTNQSIIRSYLNALGTTNTAVDDIAQEAFLIAYKRFHTYDPDANFAAWVCSIARNLLWNDRRKTSRRFKILSQKVTEFLSEQDVSDLLAIQEQEGMERAALRTCLEKLSKENRELIEARYQNDLEPKQMAELLDAQADTIRQRLMRIRRALHKCINAEMSRFRNKK